MSEKPILLMTEAEMRDFFKKWQALPPSGVYASDDPLWKQLQEMSDALPNEVRPKMKGPGDDT